MRQLNVHVDRRLVGVLHEGDDLWRFSYDARWMGDPDGFDLAPGLPRAQQTHVDGGTHRPVQWYFDNLLPEELLRQAISRPRRQPSSPGRPLPARRAPSTAPAPVAAGIVVGFGVQGYVLAIEGLLYLHKPTN